MVDAADIWWPSRSWSDSSKSKILSTTARIRRYMRRSSGGFAPIAFDRRRGRECATGRNPNSNFTHGRARPVRGRGSEARLRSAFVGPIQRRQRAGGFTVSPPRSAQERPTTRLLPATASPHWWRVVPMPRLIACLERMCEGARVCRSWWGSTLVIPANRWVGPRALLG